MRKGLYANIHANSVGKKLQDDIKQIIQKI